MVENHQRQVSKFTKNKKGTILGFSMKGETIAPSAISGGPDRFKENIVLNITATLITFLKMVFLKWIV